MRYDWTNQLGSTNSEDAKDVVVAMDNSIYVVGQFMNTVDFNPGPAVNSFTVIIPTGYIAHYASDGTFINAFPLLSSQITSCNSIEVDDSNNIYVSGNFSNSVDFDPSANTNILSAAGTSDLFLAKYNSAHQLVWVRQYGGTLNTFNNDLDYKKGRLVINGKFNGSVNFAPTISYTTAGSYDIFALCVDKNGIFKWAKTFGNMNNEDTRCITQDDNKNVYIGATFTGTIDVNPNTSIVNNITSNGINGGDVLILKLDSLGNYTWVRTLNGAGAEFIFDIKTHNNYLYANGGFSWTVDFDPGLGFDTINSNGGLQSYAWQLDLNGNHNWVRTLGNTSADFYDGRTISFSKSGNPYFMGIFEGAANFNHQGSNVLSSKGAFDIYVLALKPNGDYSWATTLGGTDNDIGLGIATDTSDNLTLCGFFRATVDFNAWAGVNNFTATASSPANLADAFLTKWRVCETESNIIDSICGKAYTWNNQVITVAGIYTAIFANADSCDSTVVLNISFVQIDTSTTINQQTITASQSNATYQWYECSNWQPIVGATQQSYAPNKGGTFAVLITYNGCTDTSSCRTFIPLNVGNIASNFGLKIYPNPANNILMISNYSLIKSIKIYSMEGKTIISKKLESNWIDISAFTKGSYIVEVELHNNQRTKQLITKY